MDMKTTKHRSTRHQSDVRRVSILGSTGSIGCNPIDLISCDPDAYSVEALTANVNVEILAKQAKATNARLAVVADETYYSDLKDALAGTGIEAAAGESAGGASADRRATSSQRNGRLGKRRATFLPNDFSAHARIANRQRSSVRIVRLDGGLDRFCAGVAQEYFGRLFKWSEAGQSLRKLDPNRMVVVRRYVDKLFGLLGNCRYNFGVSMARGADRNAGSKIDIPFPVNIPYFRAFSVIHDEGICAGVGGRYDLLVALKIMGNRV